ncbi:phytoene desaturase family protein [Streptomyces sp. NBC_01637]|uniref:phytoene desaturase family protein n=1 Tax=unclassified Streptomyces TaxID=2593676 RepID=UPI003864B4B2|nr:NAD(P)/FAD-dependent oxidoreductase [Streptomyces sp. NBC_01653]WTD34800.1 NAD(P)/FAD-dependent oxidoreductase [Streptomyces sp. NBC_01643]WTD90206.1 NAD(P)/FAD-dependent oxidoreductase [Streptomyces sp. NBC_01637]
MTGIDAAVVGTGPNGLAAAVTLARAGLRVELYERADDIGGGLRSKALFDEDVMHDMCAAVHPMAAASPFFREFDLGARGVELLTPDISYAHPLDDGRAALAHRDLSATCEQLGPDGERWRSLMQPLLDHSAGVVDFVLAGRRTLPRDPLAPLLLARRVLRHSTSLGGFRGEEAAALLTGVAAHAMGRLPSIASGAVAMLLGHLAHGSGWPLPRGGSARIAEAMAVDITAHGGLFHTGAPVTDLRQLRHARTVFLDTSPKTFLALAASRLPARYARALAAFRYGPGAAKVDFLVSEPIPWRNPAVGRAGTVHIGGTHAEMVRQEAFTARGVPTDEPFVLLSDPAVTDPDRARPGRRPVWAYAHVPNGDTRDPIPLVRSRIERYAPGFDDTVIAQRAITAADYESYNPNYVGGDIGAGAITLAQSLLRPTPRLDPYRTPLRGVYLCSASTPPGPSVHGMSGYLAAVSALRREFGVRTAPVLSPAATASTR